MKATEVDMSRHISLQISALKLCGLWFYIPYSVKSLCFWISIFIKLFIGVTAFLIPTGCQLLYVINLILSGNAEIQDVAGIINLVITELQTHLRLLDLFLRRDIFTELRDQLMSKDFQFNLKSQRIILEKAVSFSRKLFWVLIVSCTMDIAVHVIMVPGFRNFQVLPLKMDLVWLHLNENIHFYYIFAYQIIYKPPVILTFVAIQTLPSAVMLFSISQLDVLIYNLENVDELAKEFAAEKKCDTDTAFKEVFKGCILHHSSIIRFVNTLQDAFGGQFTALVCLSGGIICTTCVQILSIESPAKNFTQVIWILPYLCIFICNLFIDCYFSNLITTKSLHIATVVYSCSWIDLPMSFKKNLELFIAKTQQPVVINAASFVPISLKTFTKIMDWTYKGFAVMNQMKK